MCCSSTCGSWKGAVGAKLRGMAAPPRALRASATAWMSRCGGPARRPTPEYPYHTHTGSRGCSKGPDSWRVAPYLILKQKALMFQVSFCMLSGFLERA